MKKKVQVLEISVGKDGLKVNGQRIGTAPVMTTYANHEANPHKFVVGDKVRYSKRFAAQESLSKKDADKIHTVTEARIVNPSDMDGMGAFTSGLWIRTNLHKSKDFKPCSPDCSCTKKEFAGYLDASRYDLVEKKVVSKPQKRRSVAVKKAKKIIKKKTK